MRGRSPNKERETVDWTECDVATLHAAVRDLDSGMLISAAGVAGVRNWRLEGYQDRHPARVCCMLCGLPQESVLGPFFNGILYSQMLYFFVSLQKKAWASQEDFLIILSVLLIFNLKHIV
ncbi:hypothetical protein J6590_033564 [Homalodisca vitripennis]|nr:hypothetical protein J6590_033564 [Homalodisca vitripennis]